MLKIIINSPKVEIANYWQIIKRVEVKNDKMLQKGESEEHRKIKLALVSSFKAKQWKIEHIDGENDQTELVKNTSKVGDGEDKRPDIDAEDKKEKRTIRGEAKINNGDFNSDHSITQYKLFSNRSSNGINSWLIIGVPEDTGKLMEKILDSELNEDSRKNVAVWEY